MLVIKELMVPIDFHRNSFTTGSQWGPTTVWFFKILQNIFICVQHKKEAYTGLEQHEGEVNDDDNFHFCVNYSFKSVLIWK